MRAIWQISRDVLLEARRNQLFLLTLGLSFTLILLFTAVSHVEESLKNRLFSEISMTLLWLMHFILAIFFVTESLYTDVKDKSIYFYLVRNVSRQQYLVGKYLGFLTAITVSILVSGLTVLLCSTWLNSTLDVKLVWGLVFLIWEMALIVSVLTLLSFMFSKLITVFLFLFLFFFASLLEYLSIDSGMNGLLSGLLFLAPNFKYYSYMEMIVHAKAISSKYIVFLLGYTGCMSLFYLIATSLQFRSREL
ncbi:MAG: ABC-2 transporter permease [Candidatus Cloacimonetes bacterium]|nr:ABC-2 transporter permease [Candidatus Cloacimonadota bacterium]